MEENRFSINSGITMLEYVALTRGIAEHFFDEEGNYVPYYGELNAMRLFYNFCVEESPYDLPEIIEDISDMKQLVEDIEFFSAFNDARCCDHHMLTFGDAYEAAQDMVSEKNSFAGGLRRLISVIDSVAALLPDIMPDGETIHKSQNVIENISSEKITAPFVANASSPALGNADFDGEHLDADAVVDIKNYKE